VRIGLVVGAAAATAAVVAVGGALLQSRGDDTVAEPSAGKPRAGAPPMLLDLGVRADDEAVALRRAAAQYDRGQRSAAGRIFARFDSVNAEVGSALARWPDGTVSALERLSRANPRSALVRLNLGLALFWAGREEQALAAWRAASRLEPDSVSAVRAEDFLNPDSPPGLPIFVASFRAPRSIASLPAGEQVAARARAARTGGVRAKLLYGIALQRLGRPRSAEHQFASAAALAPDDVEAQVAAAVGRFRKGSPERAFSRLGPLSRRYPREPTVRFHLGLLLLWLGEVQDARRQLVLARSAGPRTPLGREANRFLERLDTIRTG
jgi:predicted Zn-dependent protease